MSSPEDIVKALEAEACEVDLVETLRRVYESWLPGYLKETGCPPEALEQLERLYSVGGPAALAAMLRAMPEFPEAELVDGLQMVYNSKAFLDHISTCGGGEAFTAIMKDPSLSRRMATAVARAWQQPRSLSKEDADNYSASTN